MHRSGPSYRNMEWVRSWGRPWTQVGASCWRGLDTLESACTSQILQRYVDHC